MTLLNVLIYLGYLFVISRTLLMLLQFFFKSALHSYQELMNYISQFYVYEIYYFKSVPANWEGSTNVCLETVMSLPSR